MDRDVKRREVLCGPIRSVNRLFRLDNTLVRNGDLMTHLSGH
jgi:hypothetical protein